MGAQGAREGRARAGFLGAAARLPRVRGRPPLALPRARCSPSVAPESPAARPPPSLLRLPFCRPASPAGPSPLCPPRPPLPHHPEICQPPHICTCSAAPQATLPTPERPQRRSPLPGRVLDGEGGVRAWRPQVAALRGRELRLETGRHHISHVIQRDA